MPSAATVSMSLASARGTWAKMRVNQAADLVIGGYTVGGGKHSHVGSGALKQVRVRLPICRRLGPDAGLKD